MFKGHLHPVESLGTVDEPGLGYILLTQGCLLRCLYCYNPDTWKTSEPSREVTIDEMVNEILPCKPYLDASGSGMTVSSGEPLLQMPFLEELFTELKENGVYTHLDASAGCANDVKTFQRHFEGLQKHTDLISLDTKHIDNGKHIRLTGKPNAHILDFACRLSDMKQLVRIRRVLVPGYSGDKDDLVKLGESINSLDNVERSKILSYHQLGVHKRKTLGIAYELEDVEAPDDEAVKTAYRHVSFKGKIPARL